MGIFDVFKKKAKIPQQIDRPNETVNIVNQVSASGRTNATQVDIDFDTINSIKSTFVAFDVETTGSSVRNQKYEDIPPIEFNKRIDKEDVKIVAMNNRCPLSEVININDWEKGYDVGSPYYYEGERARKEGKIDEAIVLFDKARYYGYEAPALYESYAKAFRQIKDYSNEILIIDEFLSRNTYGKEGVFSARRDKVIKLLFTQQESEHKVQKTAPE